MYHAPLVFKPGLALLGLGQVSGRAISEAKLYFFDKIMNATNSIEIIHLIELQFLI